MNITVVAKGLPDSDTAAGADWYPPPGEQDRIEQLSGADLGQWNIDVRVVPGDDGEVDFEGLHVYGKPGDRFVYLTPGNSAGDGSFALFGRAKLMLHQVDHDLMRSALDGRTLVATLRQTDEPAIWWRIE